MKLEGVAPEGFIAEGLEAKGAPSFVHHIAHILFDYVVESFPVAFRGVCAQHKPGNGQENGDRCFRLRHIGLCFPAAMPTLPQPGAAVPMSTGTWTTGRSGPYLSPPSDSRARNRRLPSPRLEPRCRRTNLL